MEIHFFRPALNRDANFARAAKMYMHIFLTFIKTDRQRTRAKGKVTAPKQVLTQFLPVLCAQTLRVLWLVSLRAPVQEKRGKSKAVCIFFFEEMADSLRL